MDLVRPHIKNVELDNPYILSPMAGIGDPPYRRLCRQGGAGLVCAEMVSANALHFGDERSHQMLKTYEDEHPVSLQIFGNEPSRLAEAAKKAQDAGADLVDLNCGCPVPKITKSGAGIRLLEDESLFVKCLEAMVKAVTIPVTFKTRLGFRRGENIALPFVRRAAEVGVSAVTIHARSKEDYHVGPPNHEALAEIVSAVRIPVFGNGGVKNYQDAHRMMEESGCAGVYIGQAAMGNPFLFLEILEESNSSISHKVKKGITPEKIRFRMDLFRRHAQMNVEYYGEELGLRRFRKHMSAYTHGFPRGAELRQKLLQIVRLNDLEKLITDFLS